MTLDQTLRWIENQIAELEMLMDWLNLNDADDATFRWYAAQQYILEQLRDRIKLY